VLTAEGRLVYSDDSGGLASGSVVDEVGRLIALCRQHGRWVTAEPDAPPAERPAPPQSPVSSAPTALSDLLGARPRAAAGGALLTVDVTADLADPLGTLHGGITVRFEGQVIHRGRTFGVARVTVLNATGKPCAVATVTTSAYAHSRAHQT
jgi:acyl-coenzyme A thioesterase PaaI-like protein